MNAIDILREQLQEAQGLLEGTIEGVSNEQASWKPGGTANPIGATYAHAVLSVDMAFNMLLRESPMLATTDRASQTGLTELPPGGGSPGAWGEWGRTVEVDLTVLRDYAHAVFADAYRYLEGLPANAAERPVDLSAVGFGKKTLGWVVSTTIMNVNLHCGEVACLKGLQGLSGYPV